MPLHIKDDTTAALSSKLAHLRGTSKQDRHRGGLTDASLAPRPARR